MYLIYDNISIIGITSNINEISPAFKYIKIKSAQTKIDKWRLENSYPVYNFELSIDEQLYNINKEYEDAVNNLTVGVPKTEIDTWIKQENEARAYLVDKSTSTPLIDSIALARGVEKLYLVNKIIEKSDVYARSLGELIGIRQLKEKSIIK